MNIISSTRQLLSLWRVLLKIFWRNDLGWNNLLHSGIFNFCSGVSISKAWQASVLYIQKTDFLKVLKLRSYRTCYLKSWSFVRSLKSPALFLESPVRDIKFSHQLHICKEFLRMKSVLLNTESVLHKTLQIICLLILTLHSFSSSLWQPCYSLKDDVSDLTFQDTLWYSWAYEKTVVPLMWSCMMLLLEKCHCSFEKGFHSLS